MYVSCNFCYPSFAVILTKTRNNLKPEATYEKQETIWNNLKQLTTSKKQPETTYSEQEMTWDNQQWARNDMKWPETT